MEPVAAVKSCFRQYATFSGRAPRSEFWFFTLFQFISYYAFSFVVGIVSFVIRVSHGFPPLAPRPPGFDPDTLYAQIPLLIWSLALFLPSIAVTVRRLHDIDRSGWWYWLYFVPLVGLVLTLVWNCERGTRGANRFGPDPLVPSPAR